MRVTALALQLSSLHPLLSSKACTARVTALGERPRARAAATKLRLCATLTKAWISRSMSNAMKVSWLQFLQYGISTQARRFD
ncbi:hypothetical protein D3C85_1640110 [compost metagenome]